MGQGLHRIQVLHEKMDLKFLANAKGLCLALLRNVHVSKLILAVNNFTQNVTTTYGIEGISFLCRDCMIWFEHKAFSC